MNLKHLLPLSLLTLTACGGGTPDPDPGPTTPPPPTTPAECDATGLTLAITSPVGEVATRGGPVSVQLAPSGKVDKVELLRDGAPLAVLVAPYTYVWDTTSQPEGRYTLSGRATCGGKTVDSEARTLLVDRTAPAVSARRPQPGADTVAAGEPIAVDFSEPLLAASVTDVALVVKVGGTPVEKTLSLSPDGRTLTVVPRGLVAPASVELTFGTGLTDRAGNALEVPTTAWSFTLPAWVAVGAPLPEESGYAFPDKPMLGFDADGAPVVAFEGANATGSGAASRWAAFTRRWDGVTWAEWKPRVDGPLDLVRMAVGAQGHMLMSYQVWNGLVHHTHGLYQAPGQAARTETLSSSNSAVVAVAPNGDGFIASITNRSPGTNGVTHSRINVRRVGATSESYLPYTAINESITFGDLTLALDPQGQPLLGLSEPDKGYIVLRQDGGQWVQRGPALTNSYAGQPALKVDGEGRPIVVFRFAQGGASTNTLFVYRLEGGSWVPLGSYSIGTSPVYEAASPVLALDAQGQLYLAYTENTSPIRVDVRKWTGSAWKSLGTLSQAGAETYVGPGGLGFDKEGRPTLAVQVDVGGDTGVRVWRLNQ